MKSEVPVVRIAVLFTILAGLLYPAPVRAQTELDGAWEVTAARSTYSGVIEPVQPGLYLFHGGYYSVLHLWTSSPRPFYEEGETRQNISHEKLLAIVTPVEGNSGRYTTDASKVTMTPMVAIDANFMNGGSVSYTFRISGDELTLEDESRGRVLKLRRLR